MEVLNKIFFRNCPICLQQGFHHYCYVGTQINVVKKNTIRSGLEINNGTFPVPENVRQQNLLFDG